MKTAPRQRAWSDVSLAFDCFVAHAVPCIAKVSAAVESPHEYLERSWTALTTYQCGGSHNEVPGLCEAMHCMYMRDAPQDYYWLLTVLG